MVLNPAAYACVALGLKSGPTQGQGPPPRASLLAFRDGVLVDSFKFGVDGAPR